MIRILHIIGRMDRAGAETMVMNLYRVLDKTKFQFDFLYFTDDVCDFDEEIKYLGGNIYRLPASRFKNPINRMLALIKMLKENNYIQIIHCHTLFSNAFHLIAGKLAGVKVRIAHSHNTSDFRINKIHGRIYHSVSRFFIRKMATHFIGCGEAARQFLFPKVKEVHILPNSIDIQKFASITGVNKAYVRQILKVTDDTFIIVQIGRLLEVKNHKFSIEFASFLKSKKVDFRIVFIGDGNLRKDLENLVKKKQVEDKITFLGVRQDIPHLLAGADLVLMPSLHEGFPVVLVESQATGIPALISDCISKEVDLGVELIEFADIEDDFEIWSKKIQLLNNRNKLDETERVSIIMEKGFDINSNIKHLESLYSSII